MVIVDVAKFKHAFPLAVVKGGTCPANHSYLKPKNHFSLLILPFPHFQLVIKSFCPVSLSFHLYCQHPRTENSPPLPGLPKELLLLSPKESLSSNALSNSKALRQYIHLLKKNPWNACWINSVPHLKSNRHLKCNLSQTINILLTPNLLVFHLPHLHPSVLYPLNVSSIPPLLTSSTITTLSHAITSPPGDS